MRVLIFGATGMVGQGVLRECLLDPDVVEVLAIGRNATGQAHPKLREVVTPDFMKVSAVAPELKRFDACFFCLGVSSSGMAEMEYRRVTFDVTLAVARTLAEQNPDMTFIYVSGAGTDSTGRGRSMWARVKGQTENALLGLPFKAVMFRPGGIAPLHGIKSRTKLYRILYDWTGPLWPVLYRAFPQFVTTTEQVGRAMLRVARFGAPKRILETRDINAL
ncbi:MAG: NAD(P)H-binding protein [Myxococcaceae bacterium]